MNCRCVMVYIMEPLVLKEVDGVWQLIEEVLGDREHIGEMGKEHNSNERCRDQQAMWSETVWDRVPDYARRRSSTTTRLESAGSDAE